MLLSSDYFRDPEDYLEADRVSPNDFEFDVIGRTASIEKKAGGPSVPMDDPLNMREQYKKLLRSTLSTSLSTSNAVMSILRLLDGPPDAV